MGLEQHDHTDLCWINRQAHEGTCERTLPVGFFAGGESGQHEAHRCLFPSAGSGRRSGRGGLNAEPSATRETLEALPGWSYFPYCILASAVLYSKKHFANARYHDPKMLALTLRLIRFPRDEEPAKVVGIPTSQLPYIYMHDLPLVQ
jgi:hypothetical protein